MLVARHENKTELVTFNLSLKRSWLFLILVKVLVCSFILICFWRHWSVPPIYFSLGWLVGFTDKESNLQVALDAGHPAQETTYTGCPIAGYLAQKKTV